MLRGVVFVGVWLLGVPLVACEGGLDNREEFERLLAGRVRDAAALDGAPQTPQPTADAGQAGAGGGGTGGTGPGGSACEEEVEDLLATSCATSDCHQSAEPAAGLDLESSGLASRLNDAPASATCEGELLIDTARPEESLLYTKLTADPPCGVRMPLIGDPLDDAQLACVLTWVEARASEGPGPGAGQQPAAGAGAGDGGAAGDGAASDAGAGDPVDVPDGTPLDRSGWVATASVAEDISPPGHAIDGDPETRYSSGAPMAGGERLQIDLGEPQTFSELELDTTESPDDYARGYALYATDDPDMPGAPIAEGTGSGAVETISFPEQTARYLIVEQTGSDDTYYWSVHELVLRR